MSSGIEESTQSNLGTSDQNTPFRFHKKVPANHDLFVRDATKLTTVSAAIEVGPIKANMRYSASITNKDGRGSRKIRHSRNITGICSVQ